MGLPSPPPQVEFGSIFRGTQIERRLKHTLNRLRRGSETHWDFAGVALLEAHPFLADPDLMAQGTVRRHSHSSPLPRPPSHIPLPPSALRARCTSPLPPLPALLGVLVCLGGPTSYAGHHHAALIAADGDFIVEHVSAQALQIPLVPDDLSPHAFATYERLIASPPVCCRAPSPAAALPPARPPRAPAESRPPWHFDFFPLCLPAGAYRSPPLSEVIAANPPSDTAMFLAPDARPLVPPPPLPPAPRTSLPPPRPPTAPHPPPPRARREYSPGSAWTPPGPASSATSPTWSPR